MRATTPALDSHPQLRSLCPPGPNRARQLPRSPPASTVGCHAPHRHCVAPGPDLVLELDVLTLAASAAVKAATGRTTTEQSMANSKRIFRVKAVQQDAGDESKKFYSDVGTVMHDNPRASRLSWREVSPWGAGGQDDNPTHGRERCGGDSHPNGRSIPARPNASK